MKSLLPLSPRLTMLAACSFVSMAATAADNTPLLRATAVTQATPEARTAAPPAGRFIEQDDSAITIKPIPWRVRNGALLEDTLQEWAKLAGWHLSWNIPPEQSYTLGAANSYHGSFKDAVRELIESLPAKIRIRAELIPDNDPPMLYVTTEDGTR